MNLRLSSLSPGERLWLWRRRGPLSQRSMASRFEISFETYNRAENDRRTTLEGFEPPLGPPTLPEVLRLARRRYGAGSRGTAAEVGVSAPTLLAAERAGAPWLVAFWRARGFRFPASR